MAENKGAEDKGKKTGEDAAAAGDMPPEKVSDDMSGARTDLPTDVPKDSSHGKT